ncbi:hypothetical protein MTO96_035742 [Rhipicephalus appendiculatus]
MAFFNLIYSRHRLVHYRRVDQDADHFLLTKPDLFQLQICHSHWYCLIVSWDLQGRNHSQPVCIRAISLDNVCLARRHRHARIPCKHTLAQWRNSLLKHGNYVNLICPR